MALGALITAYHEDDSGGLRALLPLSGRTVVEYQARCAAAAGAAPVVVLVERVPTVLNDAFERLRSEGIAITPVSDAAEAASRFEPGSLILLIGDGIVPPVELVGKLADAEQELVVTLADDDEHAQFERVDASSRWAGLALVDGRTLGSTAAMLGDWDLQSTLLRRALQEGAPLQSIAGAADEPLLAESADDLSGFERRVFVASRGARNDWASRYVLPLVDELATERLLHSNVRPGLLLHVALGLTLAAAITFTRGWLWVGLAMLVLATPLDLISRRLATLRLSRLPAKSGSKRLLWPAAGVALLALGWWLSRDEAGWGAFLAAAAAAAFAEAYRVERGGVEIPGQHWLFSRRNAILAALPFAAAGAWTLYLVALLLYAAVSFFLAQHVKHRIIGD